MKFLSWALLIGVFLLPMLLDANDEESERSLSRQKRKLLFPQFSTLQLSMCLVAQVSSIPSHRVAINTGFQINYQLPFRLADFYNPIYWARALTNMSNPTMNFFEKLVESGGNNRDEDSQETEATIVEDDQVIGEDKSDDVDDESTTVSETTEEIDTTTIAQRKRKPKMKRDAVAFQDLTAGQFYSGLKETMSYTGYHEDCLVKSVCELARYQLHDDEDNVIHDLLNLVLTPSLHQSFDPEKEAFEKKIYEDAEMLGKSGGDCDLLYTNCETSPLHRISGFNTNEI